MNRTRRISPGLKAKVALQAALIGVAYLVGVAILVWPAVQAAALV